MDNIPAKPARAEAGEPMFPIMGGPRVPWSLIEPYEAQAQTNHSQTLKQLAGRGGLSMCEAMAIMSSVPYRQRPIANPTVEDWLDFIAERKARAEKRSALAAAAVAPTPAAWLDVISERRRQIESEGWTPQHDDTHRLGEMALAGAAYAGYAAAKIDGDLTLGTKAFEFWPWRSSWWKPKDSRRDLARAAALIIAEIERLDRRESAR